MEEIKSLNFIQLVIICIGEGGEGFCLCHGQYLPNPPIRLPPPQNWSPDLVPDPTVLNVTYYVGSNNRLAVKVWVRD